MEISPIRIEAEFAAPISEVFRLLATLPALAIWAGDDAMLEPRIGGNVSLFGGWVTGQVLAYEPDSFLCHTWEVGEWPVGAPRSVVSYWLESTPSGTRIQLEHTGFPSTEERESHASGWFEHVFDPMHEALEGAED